jgi:uncharacterized protein YjaG (DUF416 family)
MSQQPLDYHMISQKVRVPSIIYNPIVLVWYYIGVLDQYILFDNQLMKLNGLVYL